MAKIRVLIVDDHAIVRAGLRMLINPQPDMEVVGEAADGHEALCQAREAKPEVLTLDLTMPGGGGLKTLEGLRQACPQTRVLVLTMHEDPSYLRAALAAGASGYVAKSAVDGELLAAIRSIAQGRTFVTMTLSDRGTHQVLGEPPSQPTRTESPPQAPVKLLSSREQEVLNLLAQGYTNKEVGTRLCLSVKTIETHRARIVDKLGLRSRADLTRYALEMGLLNPGPSVACGSPG
jgi:DNA-binding NarL/FixJ family response regulator